MSDIGLSFSVFKTQISIVPERFDTTWREFVEFLFDRDFPVESDKSKHPHFSFATFSGDKRGENGEHLYALVLDFDDGVGLEDVQQRFKAYEYLLYTSYNHQRWKTGKNGVKLAPRDKFRVILPFSSPCPYQRWQNINDYVLEFAPGVDPSSKKFVQAYCSPCVNSDNIDNMLMLYNSGVLLDWTLFPENTYSWHNGGCANPSNASSNVFDENFVVQLKRGTIRAGDVDKRYQCYCPFHDDKRPGAFISRSDKGNVFIHCHKCGTAFMEKRVLSVNDYINELTAKRIETLERTREDTQKECVEVKGDIVHPFDREERGVLLRRKCLERQFDRMLMFAYEGFGKSYYAVLEAQRGNKVLFGSVSNEQAKEQAQSFRAIGLSVQFIPGREYLLRTGYAVDVVTKEPSHPWDTDTLDEDKTKKAMVETGRWTVSEVDDIWRETTPERPDFVSNDVVVTTIARIGVWGRIQSASVRGTIVDGDITFSLDGDGVIVPEQTIVFYDDPGVEYFLALAPFDEKYEDKKVLGRSLNIIYRGSGDAVREYFVRPVEFKIGFGLIGAKLVFTTTEILTRHLIVRDFPGIYEPKLMPDGKMAAGDITFVKTDAVRSDVDGLLPPMMERVRKEGFEFEYIADGQGSRFNLVNTKGQNIFANTATVVEISVPHFEVIRRYLDELGWDDGDGNFVGTLVALDSVQQAIGRNGGYRWVDSEDKRAQCVVLCEPRLYKSLLALTRYHVARKIPDPMAVVRLSDKGQGLVDVICWYLVYTNRWLISKSNKQDLFLMDVADAVSRAGWRAPVLMKRLSKALVSKQKRIKCEKTQLRISNLLISLRKEIQEMPKKTGFVTH